MVCFSDSSVASEIFCKLQILSRRHHGFQKCWMLTSLKLQIFRSCEQMIQLATWSICSSRDLSLPEDLEVFSRGRNGGRWGSSWWGRGVWAVWTGWRRPWAARHTEGHTPHHTPPVPVQRHPASPDVHHTHAPPSAGAARHEDGSADAPTVGPAAASPSDTHTQRGKWSYILVRKTTIFVTVYKYKYK